MADHDRLPDEPDSDQVEVRKQKLARLTAAGVEAYPNDFRPSHSASEIASRFADASDQALAEAPKDLRIAGRIVAIRRMGKASFFHIQDRRGRLQVYVQQNRVGEEAYGLFRNLDVGDIVGVWGYLFRTRTRELTLEAEGLRLLAKCLRPLPEKWHGLSDIEARYRQRYLDLMVNPEARYIFEKRSRIIRGIRQFFEQRDFLEVETPMMQPIAGGAAARPFVTHHNALDMELYLRVAPELFLKRLLVGGFDRVFELNRNFRNEGISVRHNPEFTMLEFYQAYATFENLIQLTEELFTSLATDLTGSLQVVFGEHVIDLTPPWRRLTIVEAIRLHGGAEDQNLDDLDELHQFAQR